MEVMEMTDAQAFYEFVTWATIIGINIIMLAFAYWLADVAMLMQKRSRKWLTMALSALCAGIGMWRMIAIVIYFDSFTARLAIPISAALTWLVIAIVGFAGHKYILGVYQRSVVSQENFQLTQAVQTEIVEPLLRGETVSQETIEAHKAASLAFSAKAK